MPNPGLLATRAAARPATQTPQPGSQGPAFDGRPRFVLRLRYPHSGVIQEQEFEDASLALRAVYAHYTAFPSGLAQISDAMGDVINSHAELREMYARRAR